MPEIRCIIYRREIYNLQTKFVPFLDQEKLLEEIKVRRALFVHATTEPACTIYRPEKNIWQSNQMLELTFLCMGLLSKLKYQQKCKKRCIICRPELYSLQTRKKSKKFIMVEIELSISDNIKRAQTSILPKFTEMSKMYWRTT